MPISNVKRFPRYAPEYWRQILVDRAYALVGTSLEVRIARGNIWISLRQTCEPGMWKKVFENAFRSSVDAQKARITFRTACNDIKLAYEDAEREAKEKSSPAPLPQQSPDPHHRTMDQLREEIREKFDEKKRLTVAFWVPSEAGERLRHFLRSSRGDAWLKEVRQQLLQKVKFDEAQNSSAA